MSPDDFQFLPPADPNVDLGPDFVDRLMVKIHEMEGRRKAMRIKILVTAGCVAVLLTWVGVHRLL